MHNSRLNTCQVFSFFLLLLGTHVVFADQGMKAQLGEDSARFMYVTEAWGQNIGKLDVEAGALFTDSDNSLFSLAALVRNESLDTPMRIAIGSRLYYADVQNKSIGGLGFGGELEFTPTSWKGIGLDLYYFVVPSITSFLDGDGLTEIGLNVFYALTPTIKLYGGFQDVEVSIANQGDVTVADGAVIGLNLQF